MSDNITWIRKELPSGSPGRPGDRRSAGGVEERGMGSENCAILQPSITPTLPVFLSCWDQNNRKGFSNRVELNYWPGAWKAPPRCTPQESLGRPGSIRRHALAPLAIPTSCEPIHSVPSKCLLVYVSATNYHDREQRGAEHRATKRHDSGAAQPQH